MRKRILNQPIDVISKEEALYRIKGALTGQRQFKIVTLNPEMIVNAQNNFEFQSAINNANLIVPDGTGIKWALRLHGEEEVRRIPGIELAENMLEIANELSKKMGLKPVYDLSDIQFEGNAATGSVRRVGGSFNPRINSIERDTDAIRNEPPVSQSNPGGY